MKVSRRLLFLAVPTALAMVNPVYALTIPTNYGLGADVEVKEEDPFGIVNGLRGANTEIASRVRNLAPLGDPNDGTDRNSVIYLQFDLTQLNPASDTTGATLRMTYRNNNLNNGRVVDTDTFAPDLLKNGMVYYGIPNSSINEATLTYIGNPGLGTTGAPGITPDGNVGTVDFNASSQLLGDVDFPDVLPANHLPVGGALDFSSPALDAFLAAEVAAGNSTAVFAVVRRNLGNAIATAVLPGDPNNWVNFNYLFNPKEQVLLNTDAFDPDGSGPLPPNPNQFGRDNSTGQFSPQIILPHVPNVPEPGSVALFCVALAAGLSKLRRRK